jgi:transposase-like protein
MKRKMKHYPDELKLSIVQEYLNTNQSQAEMISKYRLGSKNSINKWMRTFGLHSPNEEAIKLDAVMHKESQVSPEVQALENRIKALEKELSYEKLRGRALNTMIDIAEREALIRFTGSKHKLYNVRLIRKLVYINPRNVFQQGI